MIGCTEKSKPPHDINLSLPDEGNTKRVRPRAFESVYTKKHALSRYHGSKQFEKFLLPCRINPDTEQECMACP